MRPVTPEPQAGTDALAVKRGMCHALYAYDVALSIDLDETERRITALTQRASIRHKRRAPQYFEYRPAPLRIIQEGPALSVGRFLTAGQIDAVLYDFGAVSITYRLALDGAFGDLAALNESLHDSELLLADSRRRVEEIIAAIDPALARPCIADFVESYAIFQIEAFTIPCAPAELYTTHAQQVAQLLRSERTLLSQQEVDDAMAYRIAFGADDVTLVDWDAAMVFDSDADDVVAVLEFANVELLEMRYLDQQLDDALDRAYEALSHRRWRWLPIPGASRADLRSVGQMQVDSAILFEGVNNALKLLGDQYLARLYRRISERFHLAEWDASILRKIEALDNIYEKISDRAASQRLEVLEWIIILLIAASIVLPFIPGFSGGG